MTVGISVSVNRSLRGCDLASWRRSLRRAFRRKVAKSRILVGGLRWDGFFSQNSPLIRWSDVLEIFIFKMLRTENRMFIRTKMFPFNLNNPPIQHVGLLERKSVKTDGINFAMFFIAAVRTAIRCTKSRHFRKKII